MNIPVRVKNPFGTMKFERKVQSWGREQLIYRGLELLLYLTCFFPFIELVYIGSDTQPYGLLAALAIVLIGVWKHPRIPRIVVLLSLLGIAMGVFAITGIRQISIYMVFRSYFTYASLVFIPYATFLILQYGNSLNDKIIKLCIWIWFGVGFIQKYINSGFGYSLLSRHSTNQTRGVVGLASEPSAYGYMCVFMILLAINLRKHALFYVGMLLVQILFFAGSSVTIIYLGVYAVAFIINELCMRKKYTFVKILLLAGCSGAGIYYVRNYVSKGTRIRILVDYLFENPERFLKDGSIQRRILAITDTFGSFIEHHGMPQGLSDYKWMSGIGCMLVEGGFISVIILVVIAVIVWRGYPRQFRIFYTLGFMVMMVSAIPFSSPIVGFYLGYCAYQGWLREQEKKDESIMDM